MVNNLVLMGQIQQHNSYMLMLLNRSMQVQGLEHHTVSQTVTGMSHYRGQDETTTRMNQSCHSHAVSTNHGNLRMTVSLAADIASPPGFVARHV